MKIAGHSLVCLLLVLHAEVSWSSNACSTLAIRAAADVTVSDGSHFAIESLYQSKDTAAIRHIRENEQVIAVEGPQGWVRSGADTQPGSEFHKSFALGHQFHALLLHFEEIVTDVRHVAQTDFRGSLHSSITGGYPYGGVVHLVESDDQLRHAGLLFEFPDTAAISVTFGDWREVSGELLPHHLQIDDGERVFDYRYSSIDLTPQSPLWFFDALDAPALDHVQVYRLHRKLLAAHCLGDSELMAALSAPEILMAGKGDLFWTSSDALDERFGQLFQILDYTEYHDVKLPVIDISTASDLGWIGVNVRAVGSERSTGELFDDQWAWIMLVRKIDGAWLNAGNASNHAQ